MSNSGPGGGYTPPTRPARLSIEEFRDLGSFFKELVDSTHLRWAIVAAGVAALCDITHLAWLAARFVFHF